MTRPALVTDRLILRRPSKQDWQAYRAYRLSQRSTIPAGPNAVQIARQHFEAFFTHWETLGFGRFIMVDRATDTPLGHVGPFRPEENPENELTWTLWSHEHEGKGYAYEAAVAARDHAFGTLGWSTAVSYIAPGNTRSARLALRLGAQLDAGAARPAGQESVLVYRHPHPDRPPALILTSGAAP